MLNLLKDFGEFSWCILIHNILCSMPGRPMRSQQSAGSRNSNRNSNCNSKSSPHHR